MKKKIQIWLQILYSRYPSAAASLALTLDQDGGQKSASTDSLKRHKANKGPSFSAVAGVFPSFPPACHCGTMSFLVWMASDTCSRIRTLPWVPQGGSSWRVKGKAMGP